MTQQRRELALVDVPYGVLGASLVALTFLRPFALAFVPPALSLRAGIPSPLTGMTRSFVAIARGELVTAFDWHPLGPPVFLICCVAPVLATISWVRGERIAWVGRVLSRRGIWIAVLALFGLSWVRRIALGA
jgi:hypothetical protein